MLKGKVGEIVVHQLSATISWWLFEEMACLNSLAFPALRVDGQAVANQRKSRIKAMQVLAVGNLACIH